MYRLLILYNWIIIVEQGILPVYGPDCTTTLTLNGKETVSKGEDTLKEGDMDLNITSPVDSGITDMVNSSNNDNTMEPSSHESDMDMRPPSVTTRRRGRPTKKR